MADPRRLDHIRDLVVAGCTLGLYPTGAVGMSAPSDVIQRVKAKEPLNVLVSFRATRTVRRTLQRIAAENEISVSDFVRAIVDDFLRVLEGAKE